MKKIRVKAGALLMLCAVIISERLDVFAIYMLSAALHELGHLFAAKLLGINISEISLDHTGVRICTDNSLISYKKEIILAASGPAVNILMIMLTVLGFSFSHVSLTEAGVLCESFLFDGEPTRVGCGAFFALSSILQGALNLLPIRTYDGGRILHCTTALFFGERVAETVTDICSVFMAFVFWTVSLYLLLRISSGLGIYIFAIGIFVSTIKNREKI